MTTKEMKTKDEVQAQIDFLKFEIKRTKDSPFQTTQAYCWHCRTMLEALNWVVER